MPSIAEIIDFLKQTYTNQGKTEGVIAVSGGIDSALSLTLLTRALGPEHVHPIFLPYGDQSIDDSKAICSWNHIPEENWKIVNIQSAVDQLVSLCHSRGPRHGGVHRESSVPNEDSGSPTFTSFHDLASRMTSLRKGNIMARIRMIIVFDTAKALDALVCGTENKSEHYLGYFTRFGDAASDIEPISHLYKTEVRQMAKDLGLPGVFLDKEPSAGLWAGQTDENEMGFSYTDADRALAVILGERNDTIDQDLLTKVKKVVDANAFKLQVPYTL